MFSTINCPQTAEPISKTFCFIKILHFSIMVFGDLERILVRREGNVFK